MPKQVRRFDRKTVRQRLEDLLPELLPDCPEHAINGPRLAEKVLDHIPTLNERSIRQYFTVMHRDHSSVLGKRPDKHGYYLKKPTV